MASPGGPGRASIPSKCSVMAIRRAASHQFQRQQLTSSRYAKQSPVMEAVKGRLGGLISISLLMLLASAKCVPSVIIEAFSTGADDSTVCWLRPALNLRRWC